MSLDAVTSWLTRHIGLEPETVGLRNVHRAILRRMAESGLREEDAETYSADLLASPEEQQRLIEEIVVPETWFFRDWEPFVYLERHVTREWLPAHPDGGLRVLCCPCATGEEPFSVAMTLLDAGMPTDRFDIEGVDISHKSIDRCREGVYRPSSFRGEHLAFRDRYFDPVDGRYRLKPEVREAVRFSQGNMLSVRFSTDRGPYDVVFCRNLLIYFDAAARRRAVDVIDRLLKDDGVLFAGHVETTFVLGSRFAPVPHPRSFAYRKAASRREAPTRSGRDRVVRKPTARTPPPRRWAPGRAPLRDTATSAAPPRPEPAASRTAPRPIEEAKRLADAGRLEEAVSLCREIVSGQGPTAEVYCLMGLLREAGGDMPHAEECFNKALYLDPDHHESLVHLMLLLQTRGAAAQAQVIRQRAERARAREAAEAQATS